MSVDGSQPEAASPGSSVTISEWLACITSNEGIVAVSCTINSLDSSEGITGVGLIINSNSGETLASAYVGMFSGSKMVTPAINLPVGGLTEGDSVYVAAQGECNGKHFFAEKELTIGACQAP